MYRCLVLLVISLVVSSKPTPHTAHHQLDFEDLPPEDSPALDTATTAKADISTNSVEINTKIDVVTTSESTKIENTKTLAPRPEVSTNLDFGDITTTEASITTGDESLQSTDKSTSKPSVNVEDGVNEVKLSDTQSSDDSQSKSTINESSQTMDQTTPKPTPDPRLSIELNLQRNDDLTTIAPAKSEADTIENTKISAREAEEDSNTDKTEVSKLPADETTDQTTSKPPPNLKIEVNLQPNTDVTIHETANIEAPTESTVDEPPKSPDEAESSDTKIASDTNIDDSANNENIETSALEPDVSKKKDFEEAEGSIAASISTETPRNTDQTTLKPAPDLSFSNEVNSKPNDEPTTSNSVEEAEKFITEASSESNAGDVKNGPSNIENHVNAFSTTQLAVDISNNQATPSSDPDSGSRLFVSSVNSVICFLLVVFISNTFH